jgi:uncharacterized protein
MLKTASLMVVASHAQIVGLVIQNLLFVGIAVAYWRRRHLTTAEIGLLRPTGRQIVQWIALGVGLFVVGVVGTTLLEHALAALLPPQDFADLADQHQHYSMEGSFSALGDLPWLKAAFVATGTVAAPIGEEALFRGVIYRAIRARWGIRAAIFGSSLLFAASHINLLSVGVIFVIGILLAVAYERTGSLWATLLMHCVYNGLMFTLLLTQ